MLSTGRSGRSTSLGQDCGELTTSFKRNGPVGITNTNKCTHFSPINALISFFCFFQAMDNMILVILDKLLFNLNWQMRKVNLKLKTSVALFHQP